MQACAEVEVYPEAGPIRLADVQNLLLWVLGEGSNPRWCFVKVRSGRPMLCTCQVSSRCRAPAVWVLLRQAASLLCWGRCCGCCRLACRGTRALPFLQNKPLVKRVLLLAAHGLDGPTWEAACAVGGLPAWRAHLGKPVELQARNATLAPGEPMSMG